MGITEGCRHGNSSFEAAALEKRQGDKVQRDGGRGGANGRQ